MHLSRYISYWADQRSDETVFVMENDSMTWRELDHASASLAAYLTEMDVVHGDRVGCMMGNSIEWCVVFVACVRLGIVFVPLNVLYGPFELQQIAKDSDCSAIVSTGTLFSRLGVVADSGDDILVFDVRGRRPPRPYSDVLAAPGRIPGHTHSDQDVLALCYTSGTTGLPKGVMLTHRSVETMVLSHILSFGWTPEERFLVLAPLAFTGGVICNLAPLLILGACAYIERSVDPNRVLTLLADEGITYLGGVPTLWQRIARAPGFEVADISRLRTANAGGAPMPADLLATFAAKGVIIRNTYGTTEASGGIAMPTREAAISRPGTCGRLLPDFDLEIRGDDGHPVPDGQVGELHLRGTQIMLGYWRNPSATADVLRDGWYRTGDLGLIDHQGDLVLVDRKKNMLITGGVNVYPAEVERAIEQIVGVEEVVVFGLASEQWGQEVAAIVYAPTIESPATILRASRALLGSYKAPKTVVFSPTPLLRTTSNKVARTGLAELFNRLLLQAAESSATAPGSRAEVSVAGKEG